MPNDEKLFQDNFDQALIEAIDEGLLSLGSLPREAILRNLENHFQMKKDDIPLNLAKFEEVLGAIFESGARYLEKTIAQRLCEKLNLGVIDLESSGLVFCIDELKRQLLRGERK
jgi:hypothetical protein